ncbi:MAG TPA: DUF4349 domain-containing protein [Thermoleophilia bacterium]|nr:DUF4349 domain-containing protein [Thermoleophilia bacterium]
MTRRVKIMIAVPLAIVAVVALFATVGLVARSGSSDSSLSDEARTAGQMDGGAAEPAMGEEAVAASGSTLDGEDFAAAVPPASAPAAHYLLRTGDLSLLVARGDLLPTVDRIKGMTTAMGGYVMSSTVGSHAGGPIEPLPLDDVAVSPEGEGSASVTFTDPYASLVVRVPEELFETAIRRFSRLGDVQSVSTSSEDVTSQYVDVRARLRHFRAVERRLVGFLQETTTVNQMLAVQDRIDQVQLTIEELTAQLKSLTESTSFSTLSVYLSEKDATAAIHAGNTFGGTFWNSVELLGHGARVTALALTALGPFIAVFGAVAVVVWLAVRRLRKGRRQAAPPTLPA